MTALHQAASGAHRMTSRVRNRDRMWTKMFAIEAWIEQGCKCAYCRRPMVRDDLTADHVDPLCAGGSTKRKNIKGACRDCNITKGSMTEGAFLNAIKSPKPGSSIHIWLAWSRRRIWLRTERACKRITAVAA